MNPPQQQLNSDFPKSVVNHDNYQNPNDMSRIDIKANNYMRFRGDEELAKDEASNDSTIMKNRYS